MAKDTSQIKLVEYNAYFDNSEVGYLVTAETQVSPTATYVDVTNAAQFVGILKSWLIGWQPNVRITMMQTDYQYLWGELGAGQLYPEVDATDSTRKAYWMGSREIDSDSLQKTFYLRPKSAAVGDYSGDIFFWKAMPDFSQVTISGNRDNANTVQVPMKIFPNKDVSIDKTYGCFGDWSVVAGAPHSVFVQLSSTAQAPYKHISAITIEEDGEHVMQPYAAFITASDYGGAINNVSNIAAGVTTVEVDGISPVNLLAVGDYIKCSTGDEVSQVTDITYSNGGADATLTVIRDIANSGQETFHNNAVFKKLSDLTILPIRNRATHASANAAVFTAGDSESAGTKGLVTGVVGGTANYTSTLSAVVGTVAVTVA